eukprot:363376-Chlamydomonas_euryale.AAC.2
MIPDDPARRVLRWGRRRIIDRSPEQACPRRLAAYWRSSTPTTSTPPRLAADPTALHATTAHALPTPCPSTRHFSLPPPHSLPSSIQPPTRPPPPAPTQTIHPCTHPVPQRIPRSHPHPTP